MTWRNCIGYIVFIRSHWRDAYTWVVRDWISRLDIRRWNSRYPFLFGFPVICGVWSPSKDNSYWYSKCSYALSNVSLMVFLRPYYSYQYLNWCRSVWRVRFWIWCYRYVTRVSSYTSWPTRYAPYVTTTICCSPSWTSSSRTNHWTGRWVRCPSLL